MRHLGPKLTEGREITSVCTRKESEHQVGLRKKKKEKKKSVKRRKHPKPQAKLFLATNN